MSLDALTTEPARLSAGDTINWLIALPDYPASAGWTLKYNGLCAAGRIALISTASGDNHAVTVAMATTAAYTPGIYSFTRYVESATERLTIDTITIEVLADLAAETSAFDNRTTNEKILDAIDAALVANAGDTRIELEIDGTRIKYDTRTSLQTDRNKYALAVWRERNPGQLTPNISLNYQDRYGN